MASWCWFRRRRFDGSVDGERWAPRPARWGAATAAATAVLGGIALARGEG